jgi:hypothetical protein
MVDLGVPIELVSKFMRHTDTRTTERIYASPARAAVFTGTAFVFHR